MIRLDVWLTRTNGEVVRAGELVILSRSTR